LSHCVAGVPPVVASGVAVSVSVPPNFVRETTHSKLTKPLRCLQFDF
jgi:hypothetical protein